MHKVTNNGTRQTDVNPVDVEPAVRFPQFTSNQLQLHDLSIDDGVRFARVDRQLGIIRLRRQAAVHQPRRVPSHHTKYTHSQVL